MQFLVSTAKWSFYLVYTLALMVTGSIAGLWLMVEVLTVLIHSYV